MVRMVFARPLATIDVVLYVFILLLRDDFCMFYVGFDRFVDIVVSWFCLMKIQTIFLPWCFCCLLMSQFRWLMKKHWSSRILGLRFHICSMCPAQWGWNENWFFDKGTSSAAQWGSQFLQKTVTHHWNWLGRSWVSSFHVDDQANQVMWWLVYVWIWIYIYTSTLSKVVLKMLRYCEHV